MNLIAQLYQKLEHEQLWDSELELRRNDFLKERGSLETRIFYINEGSLRMFYFDEEVEHITRFGYSGDLIAALDSFISEKPSEMIIQAIKKTKLKVISKKKYMDFIKNNPEMLDIWLKILEGLVYDQMQREHDLLLSSPHERYLRVMKRSPRVFQEIPHKLIASYLRMTPETLSRIKKS